MNKLVNIIDIVLLFILSIGIAQAQDIEIIVHRTTIDSTIGAEMVFDFEVINNSQFQQTIFEVRTINNLPSNWQSSLCFGVNCFSPTLDSIATTPPLGDPLEPGDTLITSLHVVALTNDGTANVQIQIGTFLNQTVRTSIDFTARVNPVSVEDERTTVKDFYLQQNYPNPFNPSTKINFGLKKAGNVEITVYNILGNKVATLLNGYKPAGNHSVSFDASNLPAGRQGLSSGVYLYRIVTNEFVQTRKMILEK
ncbi:MAG: T9SS type A sorting domain-containing protein [Ignavibacteriota bacterium]